MANEEIIQTNRQTSLTELYHVASFNLDEFKAKLLSTEITDSKSLLKVVAKPENILGMGGNGIVYRIPQVAGYVLKVHNRAFNKFEELMPLELVDDQFPEMNFGQPVASIGIADILKEQTGMPAGVPYGDVRRNKEIGNAVYETYLRIAADMPQDAYDQLARLFELLNKNGLFFDPSKANNILVDSERGKFNLVDLYHQDGSLPRNSLSYMIIALLDNAYARQVKDEELELVLVEYRRQILVKCIKACNKVNLPATKVNDSSLEYSFMLSGMKDEWEKFVAELA